MGAEQTGVRVLRDKMTLLDEVRNFGDELTPDEVSRIPAGVLRAMLSQEDLEILVPNKETDNLGRLADLLDSLDQRLSAVSAIEERLADLEKSVQTSIKSNRAALAALKKDLLAKDD